MSRSIRFRAASEAAAMRPDLAAYQQYHPTELEELVQRAADQCPTQAISIAAE